jgi:hypothetical protein
MSQGEKNVQPDRNSNLGFSDNHTAALLTEQFSRLHTKFHKKWTVLNRDLNMVISYFKEQHVTVTYNHFILILYLSYKCYKNWIVLLAHDDDSMIISLWYNLNHILITKLNTNKSVYFFFPFPPFTLDAILISPLFPTTDFLPVFVVDCRIVEGRPNWDWERPASDLFERLEAFLSTTRPPPRPETDFDIGLK